jgi:hypothetical protein
MKAAERKTAPVHMACMLCRGEECVVPTFDGVESRSKVENICGIQSTGWTNALSASLLSAGQPACNRLPQLHGDSWMLATCSRQQSLPK